MCDTILAMRKTLIVFLASLSLLSCTAEKPAMVLEKPNQMPVPSKPKKITNKQNLPTVLFYFADWCPYCNQMAATMTKIQEEYAKQIFFYYVDTDSAEGKKIAAIYRPNGGGIPYMQFYTKNGDFKNDILGLAEYQKVKAHISSLL